MSPPARRNPAGHGGARDGGDHSGREIHPKSKATAFENQQPSPLVDIDTPEQRRELVLAELRELREWHRWQASVVEAVGIGVKNRTVSVVEVERFLSLEQEGTA